MGKVTRALVFLSCLLACGKGETGNGKRSYDLLLRGGWIVDGSGNPRHRGDVAIAGDRIARLGFLPGAEARETLDVAGLVVAPGFIDMMGQSEINVLIDNRVLSKVTQGVTAEVTGEGGSVAPLTDHLVRDDSDAMKKWHYREDWRDLDGYIAQLERHGSTVNIATFVGATQVRLAVIGNANRQPTAPELAHMAALVDTLMEQGALGVWTALEYAPASYSATNEIIALARAARRQDAGAPARRDGAPHRRSRELLLRGGGRRGGVDHRDVSGLAALSPGQADQRDRRGAAPGSGGNGVRHRAR